MLLSLRELTPQEEVNYRYDCPYCGGDNSFSIIRSNGQIRFHCFKASCQAKGKPEYVRSWEELKNRNNINSEDKEFELKNYFEFGPVQQRIIDFLRERHSWEAYEKGYIKIGYDPKEDRLLCFLLSKGKITGAVGRGFGRVRPKSKIYPNSKGVFSAGIGDTAVLVEDCFSACSVSRDDAYTGISLNGTNLNPSITSELKKYKKVIIALDKDATRKAIKMANSLNFLGINTRVKYLEEDLKE